MKIVKAILLFISKQIGYIVALGILTVASMALGVYFVATDSQPQDAAVLTPLVTVPVAFIVGVLLSKLFGRKRKAR